MIPAAKPRTAPSAPVDDFVALAQRLLVVIHQGTPDAACALDALIHTYVAIVRTHPQLGVAAQRSLLSAARALVASGSTATPAAPIAFH